MKKLLKPLATLIFGDYAAYKIYSAPDVVADADPVANFGDVTKAEVELSADGLIRAQASYHQRDTFAFGWREDGRLVGVCYFWHGEQYRTRNFWPLSDREAKLVQVVISPECRGRGVATRLITHAATAMRRSGFRGLYARIWHSNRPSLKAFERAGWTRIATVIVVYPLRRKAPIRLIFRRERHDQLRFA